MMIAARHINVAAKGFRASSSLRTPVRLVAPRATPDDKGTIFYGGKAYTEAEYKEAVEKGTLKVDPVPVPVSPAGSAAAPSLNEVMGFSGTVPEIVNGRLAMLGFVAAVGAELASGESVLRQWSAEPTGVALTFLLFIVASLIPAFQNKKETLGPFKPEAELLNGRAAMIGFASLLAIELVRGVALF